MDVLIVVGLVVVAGLVVVLIGRMRAVPVQTPAPAAPPIDTGLLVESIRSTVDAQVRAATEQAMRAASEQMDRTYEARSRALSSEARTILDPVAAQMQELRGAVASLQSSYSTAAGYSDALGSRLDALQQTTSALQAALKSTSARGAWGEQQLRNVIELAGMASYCDFTEQTTVTDADRRQRPDAVVRLPNDGRVVIDSKTPLDAYLRAQEATDQAERERHLADHANAIRAHADVLGDKRYWAQFDRAPEYVIMFIPGESFLADALRADATLLEHAMRRRVLIASPVNLLALLLAVAKGWQAFQIAEHAEHVAELGRELYKRMETVIGHVDKTGTSLRSAVESYNKMVASLESRVLVTLRRFQEIGVASDEIDEPAAIETAPRQLNAPDR